MKRLVTLWLAAASLMATGCAHVAHEVTVNEALVGAWKSRIRFTSGAFASIQDLEFMYVFNAGGTLTESSNYDGVPPVPPAYGIWRRIGPNRFEARYEFYASKPPARLEELTTGGGWQPAGRGVFVERIEMAPDAQSYTSTIRYSAFDANGAPVEGGGEANGRATRSRF
jgi:hypothetical protein